MDAPKSKNFIWIVLAGIVASVLIGMLAKILEWSFLEDFSIIGPCAWAGYAIGCYCYGEKRYTTFKEWAAFLAAALLGIMKKKTKRKYWIAAIVWLATMILANSINEYFHASPLIRGITVGFWVVAAYILFKDLMQPRIGRRKDEEEDK